MINCIYCGKFISYKDLDDSTKTKSEMRCAWDGEPIENEWWHIRCEEKSDEQDDKVQDYGFDTRGET